MFSSELWSCYFVLKKIDFLNLEILNKIVKIFGLISLFYGISTLVGYLMREQ